MNTQQDGKILKVPENIFLTEHYLETYTDSTLIMLRRVCFKSRRNQGQHCLQLRENQTRQKVLGHIDGKNAYLDVRCCKASFIVHFFNG